MKKKLLFVDLELHKGTGSAQFFIDLLRRKYDVDVSYVSSRKDKRMPTKSMVQLYDAVIYWQVTPSNFAAKSFNKPSIYVPMYDGETFNSFNWRQRRISGAEAICFCEKEAAFLAQAGFAPLRVKYYPRTRSAATGNPRRVFFWDRIKKSLHCPGTASFLTLKALFNPKDVDGMIIRCTKSRSALVNEEDKSRYNVTILPAEEYLSQEEYLAMYSECGIFATSRSSEGIGMGFLEAMSMGKCVIVNNDATFNEYIEDGVSGILIDYNHPEKSRKKIEDADVVAIQKEAYRQSIEGRKRWENEYEESILSFVDTVIEEYKQMSLWAQIMWWFIVPMKFILDVRTWVRIKWNGLKVR